MRVLLTAVAAEAFVLLARALRPRRAVVVHPQFTEPDDAELAAVADWRSWCSGRRGRSGDSANG